MMDTCPFFDAGHPPLSDCPALRLAYSLADSLPSVIDDSPPDHRSLSDIYTPDYYASQYLDDDEPDYYRTSEPPDSLSSASPANQSHVERAEQGLPLLQPSD